MQKHCFLAKVHSAPPAKTLAAIYEGTASPSAILHVETGETAFVMKKTIKERAKQIIIFNIATNFLKPN